jgi:hypothetical protein
MALQNNNMLDERIEFEIMIQINKGVSPNLPELLSGLFEKLYIKESSIQQWEFKLLVLNSLSRISYKNEGISKYLEPIKNLINRETTNLEIVKRHTFYSSTKQVILNDIEFSNLHSKDSIESELKTYLSKQKEILNDEFSYDKILDIVEDSNLDQQLFSLYNDSIIDDIARENINNNNSDYFDYLDHSGEVSGGLD